MESATAMEESAASPSEIATAAISRYSKSKDVYLLALTKELQASGYAPADAMKVAMETTSTMTSRLRDEAVEQVVTTRSLSLQPQKQ